MHNRERLHQSTAPDTLQPAKGWRYLLRAPPGDPQDRRLGHVRSYTNQGVIGRLNFVETWMSLGWKTEFIECFAISASTNIPADRNEAFFRTLAELVGDVICYVGPIGNIVYVSPAVERLLGYKPEDLVGRHILFTALEEDRQHLIEAAAGLKAGQVDEIRTQARRRRADGGIVWIESVTRAAPEGDGSLLVVLRDITERKAIEDLLARHALQDGLTGLGNRRYFDQTFEREWQLTVSEKSEMTLLLIDIDHFKMFNDGYGHQVGDDCLRSVAKVIQSHMRSPRDLACRYGGEEIAVILGGTNSTMALQIAQRLCASVEALAIPHAQGFTAPFLTVSIGAATALAREGGTVQMPHGLLQAADHALYRAKNEGRNRVCSSLLFTQSEH